MQTGVITQNFFDFAQLGSWVGQLRRCNPPDFSDNRLPMTPDLIREALRQVRYPGFSRDIVSFGLVKQIICEPGLTTVHIEVQTADPQVPEQIFRDCHAVLDPMPDVGHAKVEIEVKAAPAAAGMAGSVGKSSIPGVKRVIAGHKIACGHIAGTNVLDERHFDQARDGFLKGYVRWLRFHKFKLARTVAAVR